MKKLLKKVKFFLGCMVSCNFPHLDAYTGREPKRKGGYRVKPHGLFGDVDDLIFDDGWLISDR